MHEPQKCFSRSAANLPPVKNAMRERLQGSRGQIGDGSSVGSFEQHQAIKKRHDRVKLAKHDTTHKTYDWESRLQHNHLTAKPQAS